MKFSVNELCHKIIIKTFHQFKKLKMLFRSQEITQFKKQLILEKKKILYFYNYDFNIESN